MFIFPGDGYNISQIGSSVSYPNSPTAEYFTTEGAVMESDMQHQEHHQGHHPEHPHIPHSHSHHHHFTRPSQNVSVLGPAATLGRHSGRFGNNGKSPFRVVVPSNGSGTTPPVCSTPQNSLPILDGLESRERALPEFSTFGGANAYLQKQRSEPLEPNGHLV